MNVHSRPAAAYPAWGPASRHGDVQSLTDMGDIQIRRLREEDFPEVVRVEGAAFGEQAAPEEVAVFRAGFNVDRTLCALEDGALVGTNSVMDMELTLPGDRVIPVAALTWVGVLPSHRRRGIFRRLMERQLEDIRHGGDIVSVLLGSEGGIYGRFGYGSATSVLSFSLERPQAKLAGPFGNDGRIVLIDPAGAASVLPDVYDRYRRRQIGAVSRHPGWWTEYLYDIEHHRERTGKMFHAVHENASGSRDGYVTYRIEQHWSAGLPSGELVVVELIAADPEVYAALWSYCLNTDLVRTISMGRGRVEEPLRWLLTDPRSLQVDGLVDYLWVRLIDLPRALAARDYYSPGDLVLEVTDEVFPANSGRYRLRVEAPGGTALCAPTAADPQLALSVAELGAVYLGGVSFQTLAAAGRVKELSGGALANADLMFATDTPPYCVTMF